MNKKIIYKIQKLLKLSENNPSVHEASAAAEAAQALMIKYQIEKGDLENQTDKIIDTRDQGVYIDLVDGDVPYWKVVLLNALENFTGCSVYSCVVFSKEKMDFSKVAICVVGYEDSISMYNTLYLFFRNEIERICNRRKDIKTDLQRDSFKIGASESINKNLEKSKRKWTETIKESSGYDLIQINKAIQKIDKSLEKSKEYLNNGLFKSYEIKTTVDLNAKREGVEEGRKINTSPHSLDYKKEKLEDV